MLNPVSCDDAEPESVASVDVSLCSRTEYILDERDSLSHRQRRWRNSCLVLEANLKKSKGTIQLYSKG